MYKKNKQIFVQQSYRLFYSTNMKASAKLDEFKFGEINATDTIEVKSCSSMNWNSEQLPKR